MSVGHPSGLSRLTHQLRDDADVVGFAQALLLLTFITSSLAALARIALGTLSDSPQTLLLSFGLTGFCFVLGLRRPWLERFPRFFLAVALPLAVGWGASLVQIRSTGHTSAGLLFFVLPVLFGAYLLRKPLAIFLALNSSAAMSAVSFRHQDLHRALHDTLFASVTLLTITVLFCQLRDHQETLVYRLRAQAERDFLTGLATRRHLDRCVAAAVAESRLPGSPGCALLLIDVDHFKRINDSYGHLVGDHVLAHIASLLSTTAASPAIPGRWGGDEFAVLYPAVDQAGALALADRIVAAVRATPFRDDAHIIALSVAIGLGHVSPDTAETTALYQLADAGLYVAKAGGRGRVGVA